MAGCNILLTDGASGLWLANGADHLILSDCTPTIPVEPPIEPPIAPVPPVTGRVYSSPHDYGWNRRLPPIINRHGRGR